MSLLTRILQETSHNWTTSQQSPLHKQKTGHLQKIGWLGDEIISPLFALVCKFLGMRFLDEANKELLNLFLC